MDADMRPLTTPTQLEAPGPQKRLLRVLGYAVAAVALLLCAITLVNQWDEVEESISHARPTGLLLTFGLSVMGMLGFGLVWRRILGQFGAQLPVTPVLTWYFAGEIGKYLPGGVWAVLGRGELAVRGGVRRRLTYSTTLVSIVVVVVAAGWVCGCLGLLLLALGQAQGWERLTPILVPLGAICLHPAIFGKALSALHRLMRETETVSTPSWSQTCRSVVASVPAWVYVGVSACVVTWSLGIDQDPARVGFAAVAAWALGILAAPVPAGAGIREVLFVALSGLAGGPAVAVAAVSRLSFILVDVILGGTALWLLARHQTQLAESENA